MKIKIILSLFLFVIAGSVTAETLYLSDKIKVWSRTGPSNEYRVKYQFTPGSKFEVLQKNEQTGFIEVKDQQGRNSWFSSKFLTSKVTHNIKLAEARQRIKSLSEAHDKKVEQLEKRLKELAPLEANNRELQAKFAKLEVELEQTRQKSEMYASGFNSEAYLSGAIVVLGGMFIGWLLSRIGGNKKRSGW